MPEHGIRGLLCAARRLSGRGFFSQLATRNSQLVLLLAAVTVLTAAAQQPPPPPVEGGTIRGFVLGTGGPVGGARIQLSGVAYSDATLTRDDGSFEFKVDKLGAYAFRADSPGYRPARGTVRVEVPGQVATPTIRLSQSSLHVRVFSQSAEGSVRPLPEAELLATPRDGTGATEGVTDAAGEFYFGSLRPGSYTLKASLAGYMPATSEVFIPGSGDTISTTLALSKGPSIPVSRARQAPYRTPQLPSDTVRAIYQDSGGYVWFATDRGVAQFDGANFESSEAAGSRLAAVGTADVRAVAEFDGSVWFGTADGLRRIVGGGVGAQGVPELEGQALRSIAVDPSGVAWVATSAGLFRKDGDGFIRVADGEYFNLTVDAVDGSLWIVGGPPPGLFRAAGAQSPLAPFAPAASLGGLPVQSVLRTRGGALLVGTAAGAYQLAGERLEPFLGEAVRGAVSSMAEDARGNIWFGTDRGAILYDTRRPATDFFLTGERINGLMNDRERSLWLATDEGAYRFDLYSFVPITTSQGLINNNVAWVYPDRAAPDGRGLWFATGGGVQRSDGTEFELFEGLPTGAGVRHVTRDGSGRMWLSTSDGLFLAEGDALVRVSEEGASAVAETPDGRIWAATDAGVRVFNGRELEPVPDLAHYTPTRVFAIGEDLWLATDRNAVRYNPRRRSVEVVDAGRGLQGRIVRWVTADRGGRVWLATDYGVEVLEPRNLRKLEDNGGVEAGADAQALLLDADGFMWVGMGGGRVRKIAFYEGGVVDTSLGPEELGVATAINAIVQDASGAIWFATDAGATQHLPVRTAPMVSGRVEVDGRPVGDQLVPPGPHTIRFLFHGISMIGGIRYLYRFDEQGPWQLLPVRAEAAREIAYPQERIASGTHLLELRALNRDLYGVDAAPTPIRLRVDVPIWRKAWFYGLSLFVVTGLAAGAGVAYRYKTREYTLPPELRTHVPIEPNPYIVGNPIRSESMFFGREDDFRYVRTKLEGASQGVVVVLCGDRRTGKSSILYQILNGRLGARFIPVFVDLQEMVVSNDREFFRRVARHVAEAVGMDRAEVDAYGFADAALNPYHQFVDFLDDVLARIGDRALLVLIDEYELLEAKVEEGRLSTDIFLFLAGLMDNKERLSFVFTGSRRLEDRDRRYWREILRRSFFRKIGFLSPNDARRLVTEPVTGRVVYGRGVLDRIVRLTAGQPFYTQVVCQTAVDYLNEHRRNALTNRDLARVVEEITDHPLPQMIYFWDALSPDERVVLALLAEDLDSVGDQGWSTAGDIAALIGRIKAPVDLSENTIHLTLEELFRTEVLEKNALEGYRFRIDLLRLWVRRSHSIWQVLKER
jgi:ligand-binding sensor domain-containing protein/AAA+ ATPase superfamily predicted ATPase